MTNFQIIYMNGGLVLNTESRTHETSAMPSERMIKNCLHSICVKNNITNLEFVKAELYRNNDYICSYRLISN